MSEKCRPLVYKDGPWHCEPRWHYDCEEHSAGGSFHSWNTALWMALQHREEFSDA